jgi:Protein of unknown function (DUF2971)
MYAGSRQQRRAAARQFAKTANPSLQELRDKQRQDLARETAIYSMSATREQILLWSHYAANHTGVCIHVDHTRPPFSIALPVIYSEDYPEVRVPRTESDGDTYMKLLHTKASVWGYEQEYRLCRIEHAPERSRDIAMRWDGQVAFAPIDSFTAITLGARMPEECRSELIALAASRVPKLEVWQASIHESQYALMFDRVA